MAVTALLSVRVKVRVRVRADDSDNINNSKFRDYEGDVEVAAPLM